MGWLEIHKMLMKEYGPIVQLAGLGPKPLIALYDPDYIETVNSPAKYYFRRNYIDG